VIRLLIADDHTLVRAGLRRILAEYQDLHVVAEAATGADLFRALESHPVDVLLLDISMDGPGIAETLRHVTQHHPGVRTLIVTMHPEAQYGFRVLRAGAAGYLSKERAPEELVTAIRNVYHGRRYVSKEFAELLASRTNRFGDGAPHEALSEREFEVLIRLVSGSRIRDIAADLSLSPKTVSTYQTRVLRKLDAHATADLVRYAIDHALTVPGT
jgi:two-component system invasion response regulator UvrY